jgi:DNA-binding PadR family transcriptional regulator
MGRGLSDLQKRILVYASTGRKGFGGGTEWMCRLKKSTKNGDIRKRVIPTNSGRWSNSEKVSVSRALHRLEKRGLIIRSRGSNKQPTNEIVLTDQGFQVLTALQVQAIDRLPHSFHPSSVYKYEAMPAFPKRQVVNLGDQPQPLA